jgi:hypothetical protein
MALIENPGLEIAKGYAPKTNTVLVFRESGEIVETVARGEDNPPFGWGIWYTWDDDVPWDPANDIGFARPETRYAPHPERVLDGETGFVMFSFYRVHHGGLVQRATDLEPGTRYRFTVGNHAWASSNDDPLTSNGAPGPMYDAHGCDPIPEPEYVYYARVGLDPAAGLDPFAPSVIWGSWATVLNAYRDLPAVEATALSERMTLFTEHVFPWPFKHGDAYYDGALFTVAQPAQPSEPPNPGDPGDVVFVPPRVPYERTYVLMSPIASPGWVRAVMDATWGAARWTVGGSADDAGIGPPSRRIVAVNPDEWDDSLPAFFDMHYPGADYIPVVAETPADLYNVLATMVSVGIPPVEPPPDPPEPPVEEPEPGAGFVNLPRNLAGGIHAMGTFQYWRELVTHAPPAAIKVFSAGDAYQIGKYARDVESTERPRTRTIWRRYVSNDGAYVNVSDRRASAAAFLELYQLEAATAARNLGISETELLRCIDYVGSINEVVGTFDPETPRLVDFDCHFAELVEAWAGDLLRATLLTVAVGNPHESEVELLLPVAKLSHERGHLLDYHGYWTATREQSFVDEHWVYHAGRALDGWDPVFREHGYYPLYVAGESGVVASYSADGTDFGGGQSWKVLGDFPNYLTQIRRKNERLLAWNAAHNNRCLGDTLFTGEFWGWDDFKIGAGDLLLLIEEAMTW